MARVYISQGVDLKVSHINKIRGLESPARPNYRHDMPVVIEVLVSPWRDSQIAGVISPLSYVILISPRVETT